MGVASTASRGWGPVSVTSLGLIGVELDTLLMTSVPGAVLSSSSEQGWIVVPNFLCLGFTLTGVPVMWLLTAPGLSITLVKTGLFSPALRVSPTGCRASASLRRCCLLGVRCTEGLA